MLGTCKQYRFDGGCDPKALLAEIEAAGVLVVELVTSVGDHTIVVVRNSDASDAVERAISLVVGAHTGEPHPVVGAVAQNHALFTRRFPPVEPAPHAADMLAAAQKSARSRRGRAS